MSVTTLVPAKFVKCRLWRHAWDWTTVLNEGRFYVQELECLRCTMLRYDWISRRTGKTVKYRYKAPLGYYVRGGLKSRDLERMKLRMIEEKSKAPAVKRTPRRRELAVVG
jgi:hypothetical protein